MRVIACAPCGGRGGPPFSRLNWFHLEGALRRSGRIEQEKPVTDDIISARLAPHVLSALRIMAALLFLQHGLSHLFGFPQPLPAPPAFTLYWFAGAIELVGGALLAVGLFSRLAAFVMSGEMAFAYFLSHAPHSFFPILNRGDAAILYCFVFLYIAAAGPGPWSLDALIGASRPRRGAVQPAE
jgi:putative oxidoreductase